MSRLGCGGSTVGRSNKQEDWWGGTPPQAPVFSLAPRLFVEHELVVGEEAPGSAAQAHYLGTVMRRGVGDTVRLFNGRQGEFGARITALRRDHIAFTPETILRPQAPEPGPWLVFALLKRDQTDLLVQKATELGASALLPVFTERTNTARINPERLAAIAMEAAEQSERLTLPTLQPPRRLFELLGDWPAGRTLAAALERTEAPPPAGQGALLIGPEGGFTDRELDALHAAPFIQPVSLGPRILRAETAAIAGLALLMARNW
jgi:16S rRNA (uracil1498-N3)-methyltransferase